MKTAAIFRVLMFLTGAVGVANAAHAQGPAQPDAPTYGEKLRLDLRMANIISISDAGDIDLFGATVVVPSGRPSVERCGVHMSRTPPERAAEIRKLRSDAGKLALERRYSARERHEYTRMAVAPLQDCERKFEARCAEVRQTNPLDLRKAAVERARKSIDQLAKGPKDREAVRGYLENVLAACPLEE